MQLARSQSNNYIYLTHSIRRNAQLGHWRFVQFKSPKDCTWHASPPAAKSKVLADSKLNLAIWCYRLDCYLWIGSTFGVSINAHWLIGRWASWWTVSLEQAPTNSSSVATLSQRRPDCHSLCLFVVCVYICMYIYIYECVRLWVYVSIHVNCNCGNVMQQNQIGPNPIMSFLRHGPMSPWSLPNLAARDGTRPA